MTEAIRIEILASPTPDLVHRFRNFGEDAYRTLKDKCTLSIKEIDTVSTSIVVSDIRRQDIGTVTQIIKQQLKHHHFESSAQLVRL